ncbi:predicted protein [Nematostella vectensis]|uniref:Uncharacterized protein n=1 Tax=Nematostella vectensis TaxID=45351 RepID=A7S3K5_NEMVE|nr:predicted protein [Nematostella vectensis]|eukprot:XP_001633852.1 predicted protein [Nematostella vectensis]
MSFNVEEPTHSPWFHVHFTAPTSRPLARYEQERKRIRDLIQGKDAFLAPTNVRKPRTKRVKSKEHKDKDDWKTQTTLRIEKELANFTTLKREFSFTDKNSSSRDYKRIDKDIYSSLGDLTLDKKPKLSRIDGDEKRNSTLPSLPPLEVAPVTSNFSNSSLTVKKPDTVSTSGKINKKTSCLCDKNTSSHGLSIASVYDLHDMRPPRKEKRQLVGILKRGNARGKCREVQGCKHSRNDETSGNDTEDESKRKRVRFAEGTNFENERQTYKTRVKNITFQKDRSSSSSDEDDESLIHDGFEMTFREFIEMKRLERLKASQQSNVSKAPRTSYLYSDVERLPVVSNPSSRQGASPNSRWNHKGSKRAKEPEPDNSKSDVSLPTVVN